MTGKTFMTFFMLMSFSANGKAQDFDISGYVENCTMTADTDPEIEDDPLWQNITYNRMDVTWRHNGHWQAEVGMRNLIMFGNNDITKELKDILEKDNNMFDLNRKVIDKKGLLVNLALDRCVVQWYAGRWEIRVGRQQINWGHTIVWNPANIFNTSPFVTLYYAEQSGCDALRATFYHNETARSELAASADREGKPTIALLHANHCGETDFQFVGGVYKGSNMVVGGGATTTVNDVSIRMEGAFFHDFRYAAGKNNVCEISIGADKIFTNGLTMQGEALYTNSPAEITVDDIWERSLLKKNAKTQTISHWSLAGSIYYPFTSRCSVKAISGYWFDHRMLYTDIEFKYQIMQDFQIAATLHAAEYNDDSPIRANARIGTVRLKWNF